MYKIYKCKECGAEFIVHGQNVAGLFSVHYESQHPAIYAELKALADKIRDLQEQFRSYESHTRYELVR